MSFFKKEESALDISEILHSKQEIIKMSKDDLEKELETPVDSQWALLTIESLKDQLNKISFSPTSEYNTDLLEARSEVGHLSRSVQNGEELKVEIVFALVQIVDMLKEASAIEKRLGK